MSNSLITPPLTLTEAHWLNVAFTVGYVGPLYLSRFTNPLSSNPESQLRDGWRNDPKVIKARLLFVSVSTVLSCTAMYWINPQGEELPLVRLFVDFGDARFSRRASRRLVSARRRHT
jgi:hypothetical protein